MHARFAWGRLLGPARAAALALALAPAHVAAQKLLGLEGQCVAGAASAAACAGAVETLDVLLGRVPRIAAGGNPVPGTASTIGRRIGAPRVTLAARVSGGRFEVPGEATPSDAEGTGAGSLNVDVSIGLLNGFSPAPTVGGVGSVDLLASAGTVLMPSSVGFPGDKPFTWMAGLRLGILRESFTAPGISLSGTYRRVGRLERGDVAPAANSSHIRLDDLSQVAVSAAIGKRLTLLALTAGVGYDWYSGEARVRVAGAGGGSHEVNESIDDARAHLLANLGWTVRVWTLSLELGWQSSGNTFGDGRSSVSGVGGGGLFASLAARLTI